MRSQSDLGAKDGRLRAPRFQGENLLRNTRLLEELDKLARSKGITLAQLSLAWILHQSKNFVPIPGTRQIRHLEENVGASEVVLSSAELSVIDYLFPQSGAAAGPRHDYDRSKELNI